MFNDTELQKVVAILLLEILNFGESQLASPFLRKLILNKKTVKEKRIPVVSRTFATKSTK